MGLIEESLTVKRRFGVGHFDLIIIDEAHRSVYQKYRAIFGLRCPAGRPHRHAQGRDRPQHLRPFRAGNRRANRAYGLDEAVADGYLVPPLAISVPLKFQREGIKYSELFPRRNRRSGMRWNGMKRPYPGGQRRGAQSGSSMPIPSTRCWKH